MLEKIQRYTVWNDVPMLELSEDSYHTFLKEIYEKHGLSFISDELRMRTSMGNEMIVKKSEADSPLLKTIMAYGY